MQIFKTQPSATEIVVEQARPIRFAQEEGAERYNIFFRQFNEAMTAEPNRGRCNLLSSGLLRPLTMEGRVSTIVAR
jgi:hypothetical protein